MMRAPSLMLATIVVVTGLFSASADAHFGQLDLRLQGGPYTPAIDLETVDGNAIFPVYDCLFQNAIAPRLEGDVAMHLFDGFGSLQLGFGVALTQVTGKAQPVSVLEDYEATGTLTCDKSVHTDENATTVEMTQAIFRPSLIYNFDLLLDMFDIPLVPYGRIGLLGSLYGFTKDAQFTTSSLLAGRERAGFRLGYEGALGLMLALDFFEHFTDVPLAGWSFNSKGSRRNRAIGLWEHAFLSAEVVYQDVNTFGQPGPNLTPMDMVFQTQLPLFFNVGVVIEFG